MSITNIGELDEGMSPKQQQDVRYIRRLRAQYDDIQEQHTNLHTRYFSFPRDPPPPPAPQEDHYNQQMRLGAQLNEMEREKKRIHIELYRMIERYDVRYNANKQEFNNPGILRDRLEELHREYDNLVGRRIQFANPRARRIRLNRNLEETHRLYKLEGRLGQDGGKSKSKRKRRRKRSSRRSSRSSRSRRRSSSRRKRGRGRRLKSRRK